MEEERDILKSDQENSNAAKDELIKKAWDVRDAAVKRKNNTEIELARTRIDLMQVNSQLLEAIQQKVELSQQLGMYDFWFWSHVWFLQCHQFFQEKVLPIQILRETNLWKLQNLRDPVFTWNLESQNLIF